MTDAGRALIDEMLARLRQTFLAGATDRQFFQEANALKIAICSPARWLDDRGVKANAGLIRKILETVIATIQKHGKRPAQINRFSIYFAYAVQEHMKHHGEEYYDQAKGSRRIGAILPKVIVSLKQSPGADQASNVMAEVHRALGSRRRARAHKSRDSEPGLFDLCNTDARAPHVGGKVLKPLRRAPDSAFCPQTASGDPGDS